MDNEFFWRASIDEIEKGLVETEEYIKCIVCEEIFIKGRIYEIGGNLYDAKKAAQLHIKEKHNSMLSYLLNLSSKVVAPLCASQITSSSNIFISLFVSLTSKFIVAKNSLACFSFSLNLYLWFLIVEFAIPNFAAISLSLRPKAINSITDF